MGVVVLWRAHLPAVWVLHVALAEEPQQGVDLALLYLDGGLLAGDIAAVSAAFAHLQHRAAALGLSKSEVVAVQATSPSDLDGRFPVPLLYA